MSIGLQGNCISPNYSYSCEESIKMPLQKSTSTTNEAAKTVSKTAAATKRSAPTTDTTANKTTTATKTTTK